MHPHQDEVASMLARVPLKEMHELIIEFGTTGWRAPMDWPSIANLPELLALLDEHGWAMVEYAQECCLVEPAALVRTTRLGAFAEYAPSRRSST